MITNDEKKDKVLKAEETRNEVLEAILDEVQTIRYIIAFVVVVAALVLLIWAIVVFST